MKTKQVIEQWLLFFKEQNPEKLAKLYSEDAFNHQMPDTPIKGRDNIKKMFEQGFSTFDMKFELVNLIVDGEWAAIEWKGTGKHQKEFMGKRASGREYQLNGCGFFKVVDGKIVLQRGYWDRVTWFKQLDLPY